MIKIKDLTIKFGQKSTEKIAVNNVSIEVANGESLGIVGESGSGKSLTALAIMQLLPEQALVTSGSIYFNDTDLLKLKSNNIRNYRGNKIAMIFQEPMTALNPVMKCGKQVVESIVLHQKLSKKAARLQTIQLFEKVKLPRPNNIYNSYPHQLSGGQKQRIMIAMAIANKPNLLIADEPTTALDVTVQNEILKLLVDLKEEYGMSLIFISHDLGVVSQVASSVAVMYKGEIVEQGLLNDVFSNPQNSYTKGLLSCRTSNSIKGRRLPEIDDFLSGKQPSDTIPLPNKEINYNGEPSLDIQGLQKDYITSKNIFGKPLSVISAVNNVSFKVFPGETLGLVGESGCGKTTLSRSILRLIEPDSGSIYFNATNMMSLSSRQIKKQRKNINIIFQDPYSSLNPRLSIGASIVEPMAVHGLYGNRKSRKLKAIELLQKVGLKTEHYNRYPHEFSGGQRQRIVIARTLALNPRFIICDEAVSALDVSVQAKVLNLLNDLKNEFGFTYIFISHDLNVVRYMSDRIMVMKDGQIVEIGEANEIYSNPGTSYTKRLIESIPN